VNTNRAIAGGGTGKNSAFMFRTANGYEAGEEAQQTGSGTSIFDPVLCEVAYRWFCPPGGSILDPFAGGSVRGIVASHMGMRYTGVELRAEQVAANRAQASIAGEPPPEWICGDAKDIPTLVTAQADFIFSCPPYGDLERYSDDPRDLSTLKYPEFLTAYNAIVAAACARLKPNRFACFVVGDFRCAKGLYRNFPGQTVAAFEAAGLALYNEAILVTAVGSLPVRAARQFNAGRKLGKTHQNVLVFVKGDPKIATRAIEAPAQQFDWAADAQRCYEVAIAAKREQAIREGRIAPETPAEQAMAAEGPVPPPLLHAGKQHPQEAQ
jgi:hypothetical protein